MYTQSEVLAFVKEEDVKFIRLAFFSTDGTQKNVSIMANVLPQAFERGIEIDTAGFGDPALPKSSKLTLHPDPATLAILPWRPMNGKVIRMFCEVTFADGARYEKDFRTTLKNLLLPSLIFSVQCEFTLYKLDPNGDVTAAPFDNASAMDIAPLDCGENIRREICFTLSDMGIKPTQSHHSLGAGQNEIDFMPGDALICADNVATLKWIVRTKAQSYGLWASFDAPENKTLVALDNQYSTLPTDDGERRRITEAIKSEFSSPLCQKTNLYEKFVNLMKTVVAK